MIKKTLFIVIAVLSVTIKCYAQNLGDPVINFDFGAGTSVNGGQLPSVTNYLFSYASFPVEGSYAIKNTTAGADNKWWPTTDHTGNTGGYMMVVNTSVLPTPYIFKETVYGVCENTTYQLSAWFMNLLKDADASPPDITIIIQTSGGVPIETLNMGTIAQSGAGPVWVQGRFTFTVPAGISEVDVVIKNNSIGGINANDLALDDILLSAYGPTLVSSFDGAGITAETTCIDNSHSYTITTTSNPGYVLQWQYLNTAGQWANIDGATSPSYTFNSPAVSGVYHYRTVSAPPVNIGLYACRIASNIVRLTVTAPLIADAGADRLYFKGQPPITLTGSSNSVNNYWTTTPASAINTLSSTTILTPTIKPTQTTTYILHATTDASTCPGEAVSSMTVTVKDKLPVPNTFTPNHDGVNDIWEISGLETYPKSVMQIFNRNGTLLFRSVGYINPWDGKYNGKDVPMGSYYYLIDLNNNNDNVKLSGWVLVVR